MCKKSNTLNSKVKSILKQRCFYLHHIYDSGDLAYMFCKIHGHVQNFCLKRNGKIKDKRHWSIILYKTKEESGLSKTFSVQLDNCIEDNLLEMIERVFTKYNVNLSIITSKSELKSYGWTG
jgi:hypothetical protein|tara:strand:+ start:121 stop:483 length:363 start_codon:yes stop_codon:yes gene_type:complete